MVVHGTPNIAGLLILGLEEVVHGFLVMNPVGTELGVVPTGQKGENSDPDDTGLGTVGGVRPATARILGVGKVPEPSAVDPVDFAYQEVVRLLEEILAECGGAE